MRSMSAPSCLRCQRRPGPNAVFTVHQRLGAGLELSKFVDDGLPVRGVAPDADAGAARDRVVGLAMQIAKALLDSPDFIRLGLMLALERRPVEPRARAMFIQARAQAYDQLVETMRGFTP